MVGSMKSIDYETGYQYAVRTYGRHDPKLLPELERELRLIGTEEALGMADGCAEIIKGRNLNV